MLFNRRRKRLEGTARFNPANLSGILQYALNTAPYYYEDTIGGYPVLRPLETGATVPTLSSTATSVTDGDEVTFTFSAGTHLRKDGVWVAGGDQSPFTMRAGLLDAGVYTACYWHEGALIQSSDVALTVAANDIVNDDFASGSPSADWSSTSGTITITSQAMVTNLDTSGYLERTITGDKVRLAFTVDATNLASGFGDFFNLLGTNAYSIVSGGLIYTGGGSCVLRFTPNVAGYFAGGSPALGYTSNYSSHVLVNGVHDIEILWDNDARTVGIYIDSLPVVVIKNCVDFGSGFTNQNPATFRIGRTAAGGTGTIVIDDIKIKQGDSALTPYALGSKWAVMHIIGQSNAFGADPGSYSATTDNIGPFMAFGNDGPVLTYTDGVSSAFVAPSFIQSVDLPSNYVPIIINAGVGSTSFQSNPGWADDGTGLYRQRALAIAELITSVAPEVENIALWFQGFEGDTNLTAPVYTPLLASLISDYRTAINDAACPLIIGGFSPAFLAGGENAQAGYSVIDAANEAFAESSNGVFASSLLPSPLSYQAGNPDWIHFDGDGYRGLGVRGAAAFVEQYNYAKASTVAIPRGQRCVLFDGVNDYAVVTSGSASTSHTICFRLKSTQTATGKYLLDSNITSLLIAWNAATSGQIGYYESSFGAWQEFGAAPNDGAWHHVAFTFDDPNNVAKCYIDGAQFGTNKTYNGTALNTPIGIGSSSSGSGNFYSGSMQDLRIYNTVKTVSEIQAIYNQHLTTDVIDTAGLVALWSMQEESSTTGYDISGNGNDLTYTNITSSTFHTTDAGVKYNFANEFGYTDSSGVIIPADLSDLSLDAAGGVLQNVGKIALPMTMEVPCGTFDGVNDYAVVPSGSASTSNTICFWVASTQTSTSKYILDSNSTTLVIAWNAATTGQIGYYESSFGGWQEFGAAPNDGQFHHVVMTFDDAANTGKCYIDGVQFGTNKTYNGTALNTPIRIGSSSSGSGNFYSGSMQDFRIYNTVKTAGEIAAIYNGAVDTAGLLALWTFQEGKGTTVYDASGNGNNLTLTNITESAFWLNRTPYARDWSVQYGGRIQGTNLIALSQDFDNAFWTQIGTVTVANAAANPLTGAVNADKLRVNASTSNHYNQSNSVFTTGTVQTISVYAKPDGYNYFTLYSFSNYLVHFDVLNGTVVSQGSSIISSSITPAGDGWFRCSMTLNPIVGTLRFYLSNSTTPTPSFLGDGVSGVCFYGAQLNNGSVVLPYQPTVGTAITTSNNVFIPAISATECADTGPLTLAAGKVGNPYSRIVPNTWSAPSLVNIGYTSSMKLEEWYCVTGNGTDNYIDLGSALIPANADFKVTFWVRPIASVSAYISQGVGGNNIEIYTNGGGFIFYINGTNASSVSPPFTFVGLWGFVELTRVGNVFTLIYTNQNGSASSGGITIATPVLTDQNTRLMTDAFSNRTTSPISNLQITAGGVTTYFPFSDGSGTNVAWYKSDGTTGVVSSAIQGTLTNVWANKTDGSFDVPYAPQAMLPYDTKFRRTQADGNDRYFAVHTALTGTDLTNANTFTPQE